MGEIGPIKEGTRYVLQSQRSGGKFREWIEGQWFVDGIVLGERFKLYCIALTEIIQRQKGTSPYFRINV
jgi:hypothetical protein